MRSGTLPGRVQSSQVRQVQSYSSLQKNPTTYGTVLENTGYGVARCSVQLNALNLAANDCCAVLYHVQVLSLTQEVVQVLCDTGGTSRTCITVFPQGCGMFFLSQYSAASCATPFLSALAELALT